MKNERIFKIILYFVAVLLSSILSAGVVVAQEQPSPDRQLLDAVERSDAESAETLLGKGADVNAKDEKGRTALMKAAAHGCDP
jgi:ankyrin repeat protein